MSEEQDPYKSLLNAAGPEDFRDQLSAMLGRLVEMRRIETEPREGGNPTMTAPSTTPEPKIVDTSSPGTTATLSVEEKISQGSIVWTGKCPKCKSHPLIVREMNSETGLPESVQCPNGYCGRIGAIGFSAEEEEAAAPAEPAQAEPAGGELTEKD